MIDYLSLITKYTQEEHKQTVPAFIIHSALVTKKALTIAKKYLEKHPNKTLDMRFIEEIGMLHDIGIFQTKTPFLFTKGTGPYITHLAKGSNILEKENLLLHARAARTHANISKEDIKRYNLPLPQAEYTPQSDEEEILALADVYYTKRFDSLFEERSIDSIRVYLEKYGLEAVNRFNALHKKYCE
jgi:uncharacterized protein